MHVFALRAKIDDIFMILAIIINRPWLNKKDRRVGRKSSLGKNRINENIF